MSVQISILQNVSYWHYCLQDSSHFYFLLVAVVAMFEKEFGKKGTDSELASNFTVESSVVAVVLIGLLP